MFNITSEDPERKLVETPLHGVSGTSHINSVAGGGRQSDSGSFTEDLQKTAVTGHNSRLVFGFTKFYSLFNLWQLIIRENNDNMI